MPAEIINQNFAGSITVYAVSTGADATIAAATEHDEITAGLFRVDAATWHTATLPAGVHAFAFREGDVGSPSETDPFVGYRSDYGFDGTNEIFPDTVDVAALTAQVTTLIGIQQAQLSSNSDPSRTWIMRRGKEIVGSDQVLPKHAGEAAVFFADVRALLGDGEDVQSVTSVVAQSGLTATGATILGNKIAVTLSGGTADNDYSSVFTFVTTKGATMVCTGTVGVI